MHNSGIFAKIFDLKYFVSIILISLHLLTLSQVHISNSNTSNSELYFNVLDLKLENITPFGNNGSNGYNFKLKIIYEVTVTGTLENIYTFRGEFFCANSSSPSHPRSFQLNKNQPFVGTYIDSASTATITTASSTFATDNFQDVGCLDFCIIYHSEGVKEQSFCASVNDVSFLNVSFDSLYTSKSKSNNSIINWSTLTEQDSDFFTVMKSTDAVNWTALRKIPAKGISTTKSTYSIEDTETNTSTNYYKLSVTDFNGNTKDLGITSYTKNEQDIISSPFPNPSNKEVSISVISPKETNLYAVLYDCKGGKVKEYSTLIKKGSARLTAKVDDLEPGIYFAKISIPELKIYQVKQIRVL